MSPSARPPPIRRTPTEQAHNTRKGHAASVRQQSRQRLRCVRPRTRHTGIIANRGGLCRAKPAQPPSNPGGKPKRGRQSGRGRPPPIQRRGRARRHFPAKREPPRLKPRAKPPHQATEAASRPGVLRGERIRAVPPRGAKARLSGHLRVLLLTFLTREK